MTPELPVLPFQGPGLSITSLFYCPYSSSSFSNSWQSGPVYIAEMFYLVLNLELVYTFFWDWGWFKEAKLF